MIRPKYSIFEGESGFQPGVFSSNYALYSYLCVDLEFILSPGLLHKPAKKSLDVVLQGNARRSRAPLAGKTKFKALLEA